MRPPLFERQERYSASSLKLSEKRFANLGSRITMLCSLAKSEICNTTPFDAYPPPMARKRLSRLRATIRSTPVSISGGYGAARSKVLVLGSNSSTRCADKLLTARNWPLAELKQPNTPGTIVFSASSGQWPLAAWLHLQTRFDWCTDKSWSLSALKRRLCKPGSLPKRATISPEGTRDKTIVEFANPKATSRPLESRQVDSTLAAKSAKMVELSPRKSPRHWDASQRSSTGSVASRRSARARRRSSNTRSRYPMRRATRAARASRTREP